MTVTNKWCNKRPIQPHDRISGQILPYIITPQRGFEIEPIFFEKRLKKQKVQNLTVNPPLISNAHAFATTIFWDVNKQFIFCFFFTFYISDENGKINIEKIIFENQNKINENKDKNQNKINENKENNMDITQKMTSINTINSSYVQSWSKQNFHHIITKEEIENGEKHNLTHLHSVKLRKNKTQLLENNENQIFIMNEKHEIKIISFNTTTEKERKKTWKKTSEEFKNLNLRKQL